MPTPDESHVWTEPDRERLSGRSWQCPRRLVESGTWARLWTAGTSRGAATSILPVLTLHSWPKRGGKATGWSEWAYIGRRRLAGLAGIDPKTATLGIRGLRSMGLMETRIEPQPGGRGGMRTCYRLSADLYARSGEGYAEIPGMLVGGGTWALLPNAATRHMLVVVGAMEAIADEDAYVEKIRGDAIVESEPWWELGDEDDDDEDEDALIERWLDDQRARTPMSVSDFVRWSGISRSVVVETLATVLVPMFGMDGPAPFGLVKRGTCTDSAANWYAMDRRAGGWFWKIGFLNDREQVQSERAKLWPRVPQ
jgi:hypothetical protein